jgi:hypothetical protein
MVITPKRKIKRKKRRFSLQKRATSNSTKIKRLFVDNKRGSNSKTFIEFHESPLNNDEYMMLRDAGNSSMTKDATPVNRKNSMENPKHLKASILKVKTTQYEMSLTKELKSLITYKMFKDVVSNAFKFNKQNLDKVIYIDCRNVYFENREKNSFRMIDKSKIKNDIKTNNIRILTFIFILVLIIGVICTFLLIYA